MFAIIGIFVVIGAVIGGFLMEKGHMAVLLQPAEFEFTIISGAATGTLLVANPMHIIKGVASGLLGVLKGSQFSKQRYLNTLKMMYQFLNKVRKEGLLSVEMDVEKPRRGLGVQELSGVFGRSSCAGFPVRYAAHGDYGRGGTVRHGPDDGA